MNFKSLAKNEERFRTKGEAAGNAKYNLTPFSIPIPDEDIKLDGFTVRPASGYTGYYYNEKNKKEKIVLHFTVGHLRGDILSLTSPKRGHVSTAFVVARDGGVYQLHSSAMWSYHLGRGAIGGNKVGSKKAIGIEISNYGPLTLRGRNLETAYSNPPGRDVYCTLDDTDQYIKLDKPFRGYRYYTAYTDEQYNAIIVLLRYLTKAYNIPRAFLPENKRYVTSHETAVAFKGVHSHVNYRKDKFDIGPAFDWDRVIAGVTAETFKGESALELAVKKAEAEVKAAEAALQAAKDKLADAQDALDASEVSSRDANAVTFNSEDAMDEDYIAPKGIAEDEGEEGPFELERSVFYMEE